LLNRQILDEVDRHGIYKVYDKWPQLAEQGYNSNLQVVDHNVSHFVFAGMGGSGALGDIFAAILSKNEVHVDVVKGYHLPRTANSETLVVTTSISGNTSETLLILDESRRSGCRIVAFSNGGKMEKYCTKNQIPHSHVAMEHSSRASFTLFLYSMLKVLKSVLPIQSSDILESLRKLKELRTNIYSENLVEDNPSLILF